MKLQKNIGLPGRIWRLSVAVGLLALAYWKGSYLAFFASLFTFFEAFFSWCIVYQILGKNSCPIKKKKPYTIRKK